MWYYEIGYWDEDLVGNRIWVPMVCRGPYETEEDARYYAMEDCESPFPKQLGYRLYTPLEEKGAKGAQESK